MQAIKVETVVETDGELHLTKLPLRAGDVVEAIVLVGEKPTEVENREMKRKEALERFLARARASKFKSTGPYPTRDELHERD